MERYDLIVLGGGPGGYVAAIRAAQLGKSVALVEKDKLGGVCLNRGCIPTKALLKAAHAVHEIKSMKSLGVNVELTSLDPAVAVERANSIAARVSKGIEFLMKKNRIQVFSGEGRLKDNRTVEVGEQCLQGENIILATGASYRSFPGLVHDGDRLIGAYEALKLAQLPKTMAIVGAGAIGVEFAYFWNAFGVDVHIFELQEHLLPLEDDDSCAEVERGYKKLKIKFTTGLSSLSANNTGSDVLIKLEKNRHAEELHFEKCLIAVGMTGNIQGIGLEQVGVQTDRGFVTVDQYYQTSVPGIYAIGDLSGPPLLAHVASHEGIVAVEKICGLNPHPIDKSGIVGCTYCYPQVASVGMTERQLKEQGIKYQVGKIPFRSNGKAIASNEIEGMVKVLLGEDSKLLGGHITGDLATELIHELNLFKSMEGVAEDIYRTIHPHPTMGEWLAEAVMAAQERALHA